MTRDASYESDEFLKLLTDALRAGPGSPAWHDAVARLRAGGNEESDEYKLLCTVREHLESGREYRSVRAGPGFTKKVMEAVENEVAGGRKGFPTATVIAILGGALVLGIGAFIIINAFKPPPDRPDPQFSGLTGVFPDTVSSTDFTSATTVPAEWRPIGPLPLKLQQGTLRVAPKNLSRDEYRGGGIVATNARMPGQAFGLDAAIKVDRAADNLLVQVFVADEPTFDQTPTAASQKHEFMCIIQEAQAKVVMPEGAVVGVLGEKLKDRSTTHLVIRMNKQFVIVESDGKQLYAGKHGLSPDKPRYVGVRFEARGDTKGDAMGVASVTINRP